MPVIRYPDVRERQAVASSDVMSRTDEYLIGIGDVPGLRYAHDVITDTAGRAMYNLGLSDKKPKREGRPPPAPPPPPAKSAAGAYKPIEATGESGNRILAYAYDLAERAALRDGFEIEYVSRSRMREISGDNEALGYEEGRRIYLVEGLPIGLAYEALMHEYAAKGVKIETGMTHEDAHDQIYAAGYRMESEFAERAMNELAN